MRLLTFAAVLAAGAARADYPPGPDPDGTVRIKLALSPAAPPVPAGRWNVYPEYRDQQPGNRVQGLLRTFSEQANFFHNKERNEQRDKWLKTELADLPADIRTRATVQYGMMYDKTTKFLGIADRAARFSRTEWNEYFDLRKDGAFMLLPEVQQMRAIAAAISLRMRGEVKAGEWDKAVESAKTLFGIAQALEQHPTLIGNLVGIAIAQIALNGIEEAIGQPGCPSLFWGLVAVPDRPVSSAAGLGGERVFLTAQFQPLIEARRPMTDAELAAHLATLKELVSSANEEERKSNPHFEQVKANPAGWLAAAVADPAKLQDARNRILSQVGPFDGFMQMSATQVGLLNDLLLYEELRDDLFKWYNLPHAQSIPGMMAADAEIKRRSKESVVAPLFIATTFKVKAAETRLAQRCKLLQVVEAVRLHAGATGGLPATLGEVKLPLPLDPVAGKPFTYTRTGESAVLYGENPQVAGARFVVEYTLTTRK
jgi:hypothetical protein